MRKAISLVYGVASYVLSLGVSLYAVGFVGNFGVPRMIDSAGGTPAVAAAIIDAVLLGLFAVQHSVMARPPFKRWWTRIVPTEIERSTYVLFASLLLVVLFWRWCAIPAVVWQVHSPTGAALLITAFGLGWAIVMLATFMTSHSDLFGLRQVWLAARNIPYRPPEFRMTLLYRLVRHPIMLGFVIAFWAAPVMTVGHLLFALLSTVYILVGIRLEERDLIREYGERYAVYRRSVSMLLPLSKPIHSSTDHLQAHSSRVELE